MPVRGHELAPLAACTRLLRACPRPRAAWPVFSPQAPLPEQSYPTLEPRTADARLGRQHWRRPFLRVDYSKALHLPHHLQYPPEVTPVSLIGFGHRDCYATTKAAKLRYEPRALGGRSMNAFSRCCGRPSFPRRAHPLHGAGIQRERRFSVLRRLLKASISGLYGARQQRQEE